MGVRWKVTVKDNQDYVEEIHKVVVHSFIMGDVDDPDLYAAEPLYQWQQSPAGQFIMEHAVEQPVWERIPDVLTYGYKYVIIAELEKKKLSEYYLRFDIPARR